MGRLSLSSRAVVFAGVVILAVNPLVLKLDVGFQLSFLAIIGIIYLMPIFQIWLKFFPNFNIFPLRSLLAMTLSAQIFTLPILIYNFGYMSLVALITNVLIVPLLPYIMILGFISGLGGMLWPLLGWILSFPAWLLLSYLTGIIDWFSRLPFSSINLEISWIWLIFAYLVLVCVTWRLNKKQKFKFSDY